jgi:hypothetical protein
MNATDSRHAPRRECVAALEQEIVRAWRADAPGIPLHAAPRRRRDRWRIAAAMVFGLLVGAGSQLAMAQVQGSRTRTELERAIEVEREAVQVRLQLAQQEHQRVRDAFNAGVVSEQSLLEAAAMQREMEVALARFDLNLAEMRASNAPPRDELWAPLVNGRDFVRERLELDAQLAQQRLQNAEVHLESVRRRARVGAESTGALIEAETRGAEATRNFRAKALQVQVRGEALAERLAPAEVTRRLQRREAEVELNYADKMLVTRNRRLELARQASSAGLVTDLDLKRAELDVLEWEVVVRRLTDEVRRGRP